jgi:uncharacterized phage protein (TIGR01671 family)
MMEIKFRVWDNEDGYMIESKSSVASILEKHIRGFPQKGLDGKGGDYSPEVLPTKYTLMQYTGLKDKNGKEIYEGDVVRESGDKHPSVVELREGAFQLVHNHYNLAGNVTGLYEQVLGFLTEPVEIIGNIYENPKLIEKHVN